ncbi:LytR family transcriptional attenuator [Natranaerovirga pectinivora]|uniref:LytR family transcriptional attenuator n=1 Tax=Natranaerovirga pectinivora TaxID=682400 RepID=A0A4R3MKW3_9FIRM|nr:LCP family protein [Natranaerovirga pectinivora]TCT14105.1 LytR family transcriptional attenuator [Natranaerovirga pectinivora]
MKKTNNKFMYLIFSIGFIVLISASLLIGYANPHTNTPNNKPINNNNTNTNQQENNNTVVVPQPERPNSKLDSITGLIIGNDGSGFLVDVLMVAHLDTQTNEVKIVSVPRDLIIDFREEHFKHIKENNPRNRVLFCKLSELYAYLGHNEQALKDLIAVVEIIIGLEIDHYVKVDIDAFKDIVDIVDGVEFDVPENMFHEDPLQDLYINLRKGVQILDGNKAEQLVRFRGYRLGDLKRIEVQREFLSVLITKVLSESNLQEILSIVDTVYKYLETDISFFDILKYANYVVKVDTDNFMNTDNMITIPSSFIKINKIDYLEWKLEEANLKVKELID